jgi:mevalonate kinase
MTTAPRRRAVATAPGKLILAGEHSVVYGGAALVAAIGLRATVEAAVEAPAEETPSDHLVRIALRDLDLEVRESWGGLIAYAGHAREAWERYAAAPSQAGFLAVRGSDPAHLVKVALGEIGREMGQERTAERDGPGLPPLALTVRSEIPIGSGFGSSAALAAAVPAAALAALGHAPSRERLTRLALEVERRQHGTPSGADHRTVLHGGIVRIEHRIEHRAGGALAVHRLEVDAERLAGFAVYDTGVPAESTGEVVAAVRALRDREPEAFERRLERMGAAVDRLTAALTAESGGEKGGPEDVASSIRRFERCLEEIGVVPASIQSRIRAIEARGGAAKLSGAGALSGGGAGSLLVYRPPGCAALERELAGVAHRAIALGVEGLHVEVIE